MSLEMEIVNPLDYPKWDDLVLARPGYTFFHSAAWAKVLWEAYRYDPRYVLLTGGSGKVRGLIPLVRVKSLLRSERGVSLPFSDSCEPLLEEGIESERVLEALVGYAGKENWRSLEFHGGQKLFKDACSSASFYEHTLPLGSDEKEIFARFKGSTRRNIEKATREGVRIDRLTTSTSVREYYRLHCMTRKHHGIPPQPYSFFRSIFENIISKNRGWIILASFQDEPIAGGVFFHFGKKGLYKFGASNRKFLHLRANHLVMWEAIRWYCQNDYNDFSFGRTDIDDPGLRRFKNSWSPQETLIKYYKYDVPRKTFIREETRSIKFYQRILRKTPIPVLRIMGSLIYKYMG